MSGFLTTLNLTESLKLNGKRKAVKKDGDDYSLVKG
jgi:hypothetical protein